MKNKQLKQRNKMKKRESVCHSGDNKKTLNQLNMKLCLITFSCKQITKIKKTEKQLPRQNKNEIQIKTYQAE